MSRSLRSFSLVASYFLQRGTRLVKEIDAKIALLQKEKKGLRESTGNFKITVAIWRSPSNAPFIFEGSAEKLFRPAGGEASDRVVTSASLDRLIESAAKKQTDRYPRCRKAFFEIALPATTHGEYFDASRTLPYEIGKKLNRTVAGLTLQYYDSGGGHYEKGKHTPS